MENNNMFFDVSEEMVAAWIDGTLSDENEAAFMEQLNSNADLAEILDACDDIEEEFENMIESGFDLPEEISFDDFELPTVDSIEAGLPEDFSLDNDDDDSDFSETSDNHNYYDYSCSHDVAGNDESSESCDIPENADESSSADDENNDMSDFF